MKKNKIIIFIMLIILILSFILNLYFRWLFYPFDVLKWPFCNYSSNFFSIKFSYNSWWADFWNDLSNESNIFNFKTIEYKYPDYNIHYRCFWTNWKNIFYYWKKLNNLDAKTFKLLNNVFIKDKNNVYWLSGREEAPYPIKWSDPNTFKALNIYYWKDKNNVYYIDRILMNLEILGKADTKTFQLLNTEYSKDKKYVYFKWKIIDWADSDTFSLYKESKYKIYWKDKNHIYEDGFVIK